MNYENEAREIVASLGIKGGVAEHAVDVIRASLEHAYDKGGVDMHGRMIELTQPRFNRDKTRTAA